MAETLTRSSVQLPEVRQTRSAHWALPVSHLLPSQSSLSHRQLSDLSIHKQTPSCRVNCRYGDSCHLRPFLRPCTTRQMSRINGKFSVVAFSIRRVSFSPTAHPMLAIMKRLSMPHSNRCPCSIYGTGSRNDSFPSFWSSIFRCQFFFISSGRQFSPTSSLSDSERSSSSCRSALS